MARKKSIVIILLYGAFSLIGGNIKAGNNTRVDSLANSGLESVYNLEFAKADACFDSLINLNPAHPVGYYLKCSAKFFRIVSGYDNEWDDEAFGALHEKALEKARMYQRERRRDVDGYFYEGCIYGNLGRYWAARGEWLKAFYYGMQAVSLHEKVIGMDDTYTDAFLTLGIYNYYAAALPGWIQTIISVLGVKGDRERGLDMIAGVSRRGKMARQEAGFILANIYIEEGEYEKALDIFNGLQVRYPANIYLILQKGYTLYLAERWNDAEWCFCKVLSESGQGWSSARMQALFYLGRTALLRNDYPAATDFFRQTLSLAVNHRRLKTMDGWIEGHAFYYSGECSELAGNRELAVSFYKKAADQEIRDETLKKKLKTRLSSGISLHERTLIKAQRFVLTGDTANAQPLLDDLLADPKIEPVLLMKSRYYMARLDITRQRFKDALKQLEIILQTPASNDEYLWIWPYSYYHGAEALIQTDGGQAYALESIKRALGYKHYQGEKRLRVLSRNLIMSIENQTKSKQ